MFRFGSLHMKRTRGVEHGRTDFNSLSLMIPDLASLRVLLRSTIGARLECLTHNVGHLLRLLLLKSSVAIKVYIKRY